MTVMLYCDRASNSGISLARALGLKKVSSNFVRNRGKDYLIVNWGTTDYPNWDQGVNWLNHPSKVMVALSKVDTYETLRAADIPTIIHTTDKEVARTWNRCITRKDGLSSGRGITEGVKETLDSGEFYSKVYPKTHEFRAHVVGDEVVDFVQKKSRLEQDANRLIRNHHNGWIFAHENIPLNFQDMDVIHKYSVHSVKAIGLDYGAVDILARLGNFRQDGTRELKTFRICEVNTAPGIDNTATLDAYKRSIRDLINQTKRIVFV